MGEGRLEGDGQAGEGVKDAVLAMVSRSFRTFSAQFADDRGGLVDEGEVDAAVGVAVVGHEDGPIQQIVLDGAPAVILVEPLAPNPFKDPRQDCRVFQRESNLDARRVAPPNLQPVDAVQQKIDPGVFDEALGGELFGTPGAGQIKDFFDVGKDIVREAPENVLQEDEAAVDDLHLRCGKAPGLRFQETLLPVEEFRHLGMKLCRAAALTGLKKSPWK